MSWILYVLLVLAVAGDILLAVVLAKVMHKNDEPQQKIDTADDFVRAVTPVLQSETDLLAEQLRAMQGESARTTTATLRDFSAVLAENQRQNAAASTARSVFFPFPFLMRSPPYSRLRRSQFLSRPIIPVFPPVRNVSFHPGNSHGGNYFPLPSFPFPRLGV